MTFLIARAQKFLFYGGTPKYGWIQCTLPVRAEDNNYATVKTGEIIDVLNQSVDCDFVLMVAVLLRTLCRKRITLVYDQDGPTLSFCRFNHFMKSLIDQCSHFTNFTSSPDAGAYAI